ncbi:MAG: LAGLIDADG family homing endonuclease [Acidiferrobacteraceae bacterium]
MRAVDAAYVAGFLDGDGSIHFQLVRQEGYRFGFYARATLSLSQSTPARSVLQEMQALIGGGYVRDRGTGMSDLVITSRPLLIRTLEEVRPYVRVKHVHVRTALALLAAMRPRCSAEEFLDIARRIDRFATLNYSKTKRISAADVEHHLRSMGVCAPVTTLSCMPEREDGSVVDNHAELP